MMITTGKRILIMGPPGSGKTYVSAQLRKKGIIDAVDADLVPGLGKWVDKKGKNVQFNKNADNKWLDQHDYVWDQKVLKEFLAYGEDIMFFFGISANVYDLLDLFDMQFFLKPSPKLLRKRFSQPGRKNPMGQKPEQLERIVKSIKYHTKMAKKFGITAVDASKSPEEIYNEIKSKVDQTFSESMLKVRTKNGKLFDEFNFFYDMHITKKQEQALRKEFKKRINILRKETAERELSQKGLYEKHLAEVRSVPDLKPEEEDVLVHTMMEGNYWGIEENARGKIVESYKKRFLPLMDKVAIQLKYSPDNPGYFMSSKHSNLKEKEINPFFTTWESIQMMEATLPGLVFSWAKDRKDGEAFKDYMKNSNFISWPKHVLEEAIDKQSRYLKSDLMKDLFGIDDGESVIADF